VGYWVVNNEAVLSGGNYDGFIMVHADGGDCHGTALRVEADGGKICPKCGISPDMQSTEFWAPESVKR